ncbi:MAG: efflux RND transporter periplasmic adaptor subunit [Spirochaetales bacterium]|nr:efflux RND transporter periplasmic adaptor subunit [Spirochaetales bacterium]
MKVFYKLLLVCVLFSCSPPKEDALTTATYSYTEEEEPPVSVDVLSVSKNTLVPGIKASGIVEGINEVTVISETQGIVQKTDFDVGSFVEKNDLLISVDNKIAEINKNQAKLELDSAFIDFGSAKKFYNSGSISQAEYIKAESMYNLKKAQYENALKAYNDCTIRSPISGYIAAKADGISTGSFINRGNQVAKIIDSSSFLLRIGVGERQIGLIRKGQAAKVSIPAVDELINAKVEAVAPGSNKDTGSFQVIISWKNTESSVLKSGMSASVDIDTSDKNPVAIIPYFAIVKRENKDFVFTAENNQAQAHEVAMGKKLGDRIEILSGLDVDDMLIITRVQTLKPGQRLITRNQGKSGDWR